MFETKITKMLSIKYPIIGGTMMSLAKPDFVAAISNAGGLGILASAMYQSGEEFAHAIDQLQAATDKPYAVNINLVPMKKPVDNNVFIDIMTEKGVEIVETSGHSAPKEMLERFKEAGMTWMHKCVGVKYALTVQKLGADIVTVVGYENGGATGRFDTGTLVLIPSVRDAIDLPLIGGGGVSDGRGLVAVLALGADAAIIGTRLLLTRECPMHDNVKQSLLNSTELDTMLLMRSIGATHRVWSNQAAQECLELEKSGADLDEVISAVAGDKARRMFETGDITCGTLSCGQGIGLVHDIPTVKELFDNIMAQAKEIAGQLSN